MKLDDLLSVTSCVINVKYEDFYINNVTPNNPMISKSIFNMNVIDIRSHEDKYGNGILEVEIE